MSWRIAEQLGLRISSPALFEFPLFFWGGGVPSLFYSAFRDLLLALWRTNRHQRPIKDTCILSIGVLSLYSKNHLMNIMEKAPIFFGGVWGGVEGSWVRRVSLIFLRISVPIGSINGMNLSTLGWFLWSRIKRWVQKNLQSNGPTVHGARKLLKIPDYPIAGSQLRGPLGFGPMQFVAVTEVASPRRTSLNDRRRAPSQNAVQKRAEEVVGGSGPGDSIRALFIPSWRSLDNLKGSLNHPKKVTLNHLAGIFFSKAPKLPGDSSRDPTSSPFFRWVGHDHSNHLKFGSRKFTKGPQKRAPASSRRNFPGRGVFVEDWIPAEVFPYQKCRWVGVFFFSPDPKKREAWNTTMWSSSPFWLV